MSDFSFTPQHPLSPSPAPISPPPSPPPNTSEVFKEEHTISPVFITDKMKYIPWGADNQMPYNIIDLIESDETLATCQMFNAEVCYGSGLVYNTDQATAQTQNEVDDFLADNDLATYFLGVCQDFKHFGFAVSVIILNEDGTRIVRLARKQACYVRFAPADKNGTIPYILYANWRNTPSPSDIERIELLNPQSPLSDLQSRAKRTKKFAIISRVPTPDNTYYPIPYYAALFKGKWYNIKQLISIAKEVKLKNSAPSSTTSRLPTRFGTTSSRWRASPTGWSSRSVSTRRRTISSTSSRAWRTAARSCSPRSTSHRTARSSTMSSSTRLRLTRRAATGPRTSSRR